MKRTLVAGCGYVGKIVARLLVETGWEVVGLTHSQASAAALAGEPFRVLACDISDRAAVNAMDFRGFDLVIDCVSSGRGGGAAEYRSVYFDGARHLLDLVKPRRFIFTSSTSVYAQTDGSLVDENSAAEPERETGKILRETEMLTLAHGGVVARLAGIYGPGRAVMLEKFLDGSARIEGDGQRWINQIHRDDAARALVLLADENTPAGIYNICADAPLRQIDCFRWLASHFQKPLPPFAPIDFNRKRGWTNKRISNAKLRALGWVPQFPSFQSWIEHSDRPR